MDRGSHKNRKKNIRFRAEIWDQMQFFFKPYNDHQLHAVIYLKGLLDPGLMRKAVLLSMEMVPLLASRFVIGRFHPHWEKMESHEQMEILSVVESESPEGQIDRFITGKTDEMAGPQLKLKIVRSEGQDTLCIILNHMVCDAAGFKEYLYLLGALYGELETGAGEVTEYRNGSRSSKQIYRYMSLRDRMRLLFKPNGYDHDRLTFPLDGQEIDRSPFILRQAFVEERFRLLKAYAKERGVTVNDVIFAAYYRALCKTLDLREGESLTVPCMVDLRRYLPGKKADGICNLTSNIICNIGPDIGSTFHETVMKIGAEMKAQKDRYPGMGGLALLHSLFNVMPFSTIRKFMKERFQNPMIGITNIGIIDSERLVFGKVPVDDAFITGSIKYPPYFQLALTTFRERITFTIAEYGTEKDRKRIGEFLAILDEELGQIA